MADPLDAIFVTHPDYPFDRTDLRYLGYWRVRDRRYTRDPRPHPTAFVDETWSPAERASVAAWLRSGTTLYAWIGSSTCRFCGLRPNGNRCLTDGTFAWPEGLAHYVEAHGLRVPAEIVAHAALRRSDPAEQAGTA